MHQGISENHLIKPSVGQRMSWGQLTERYLALKAKDSCSAGRTDEEIADFVIELAAIERDCLLFIDEAKRR